MLVIILQLYDDIMIFQYKTTTLKHNRTWTPTPSPNGLGRHIKVGQETQEGCSKVRNDFMDSYIIVDVPTKLKKSFYRQVLSKFRPAAPSVVTI